MTTDLELIKSLVPDLEIALSGKYSAPLERRSYARGTNCMNASEKGKLFLWSAGIKDAWREVHYNDRMGHAVISLSGVGLQGLTMADLLIDPTYLQFASRSANLDSFPNTFIGTRQEIVALMSNNSFTTRPEAAELYLEPTWAPGKK